MWADQPRWCDAAFGPPIHVKDPNYTGEDADAPSYRCRLMVGHEGPHNCQAARDDGWVDVVIDLSDLSAIEQFLGEK